MSRAWKPGDVAWYDGGRIFFTAATNELDGRPIWRDGNGDQRTGSSLDDEPRPLVVIDPLDRSAAVDLGQRIGSLVARPGEDISRIIGEVEIWLRRLTSAKPLEPTGIGAVVKDDEGVIFVRHNDRCHRERPWQSPSGSIWNWAAVDAVEVLTEGVTA